ncbi:hypothetical protein [uncultured Desulfovibrio sp.]|uniref:hypothetical protein n=1 Tax=uncultured Desulfovibrio sp. TaxID=167968 RepID=UPI0026DBDFF5|nr:hypothetical protein [uncultured Desulfovibrio sp.]
MAENKISRSGQQTLKNNSPVKQQPAVVKTISGLFAFQMPESGITLIAKNLRIVMLSIFGGSSEKNVVFRRVAAAAPPQDPLGFVCLIF